MCIRDRGGSATVSFSTTASYSIEVPAEAQSWLSYTLDEENRTITFNVAASADKTPVSYTHLAIDYVSIPGTIITKYQCKFAIDG